MLSISISSVHLASFIDRYGEPPAIQSMDTCWTRGIDTVLPMREIESEGRGTDRRDCMAKFKSAWHRGRMLEFLDAKRRARRRPATPTR